MKTAKLNYLLTFLFISGMLTLVSCKKLWACHEENISSAGSNKSHNKGMNCMQCHYASGEGEGCFNVAGTIYQSNLQNTQNGGKVELFTEPNGQGTLKYTINIDGKGNFYTTANVDYTGLYPKVTAPSGNSIYMSSALTSGACNSCHGQSTAKIGLD
ncbi:MAG: hypothetical protein RL078_1735 [Bacteroidota bacterium]|jgi:hypothetical protein